MHALSCGVEGRLSFFNPSVNFVSDLFDGFVDRVFREKSHEKSKGILQRIQNFKFDDACYSFDDDYFEIKRAIFDQRDDSVDFVAFSTV